MPPGAGSGSTPSEKARKKEEKVPSGPFWRRKGHPGIRTVPIRKSRLHPELSSPLDSPPAGFSGVSGGPSLLGPPPAVPFGGARSLPRKLLLPGPGPDPESPGGPPMIEHGVRRYLRRDERGPSPGLSGVGNGTDRRDTGVHRGRRRLLRPDPLRRRPGETLLQ